MDSEKGEHVPSRALGSVSAYSSASPSYRLPDTLPQSQRPITVLVMTLWGTSDKIPNSNKLKARKKKRISSFRKLKNPKGTVASGIA